MGRSTYAPPPAIGSKFLGPMIGNLKRPGRYTVAAIVDLGFFDGDPTYFQIVFRFWAAHKKRWAWEIVGADAIDVGLYKPLTRKK